MTHHRDPISAQVGPKSGNFYFRGFSNFFFFLRTSGFQLELLKIIKSLNLFHWKPAKKTKKVIFTLATLLPTQFSLKTKFLTTIVSQYTKKTKR